MQLQKAQKLGRGWSVEIIGFRPEAFGLRNVHAAMLCKNFPVEGSKKDPTRATLWCTFLSERNDASRELPEYPHQYS